MNGWEAESDAATLLNGLGIDTEFHYAQMADLTGSMKVKVLLAQALFGNPDILLLDEPTAGLDAGAKAQLGARLRHLCAAGKTVVLVTHDLDFAGTYSDEAAFLCNRVVTPPRPRPGRRAGQRPWG